MARAARVLSFYNTCECTRFIREQHNKKKDKLASPVGVTSFGTRFLSSMLSSKVSNFVSLRWGLGLGSVAPLGPSAAVLAG